MTRIDNSQTWRTTLLPLGSTIQQAIHSLENSCMQIVLVISEGKLAGTLTDGDIRRAFLGGLKLGSVVDDVIHRNPFVVPPDLARDQVLQLMHINKIRQLPIVDQEGVVIGLHVWNSIIAPTARENTMVIMAGGKGTRLRPHTENCPKPLLEVGGKPMLEHIIERARADGFHNFIISVHYLGHMIEESFGDGGRHGVSIEYLREEYPLGTAGALSLLKKDINAPFVVTNGDVMTDVRYGDILDFHVRHRATGTMAVRAHEWQNPFGVVRTSGLRITGFEEKPVVKSHVNAGIYVIEPNVLSLLEFNSHCDMPTLFDRLGQRNELTIVYPIHEPWLDVGRPEDFASAQAQF